MVVTDTVTINEGESTALYTLDVKDDELFEGAAEDIILTIEPQLRELRLNNTTARGVILDDEITIVNSQNYKMVRKVPESIQKMFSC